MMLTCLVLLPVAGVAVPYDVPAFACTVTLVLGFSVSMFFSTYRGVPLAYTAVYAITNARVLAMIETSPVVPWPLSKFGLFVRRVVTEHSFVALAEEWRAAKTGGGPAVVHSPTHSHDALCRSGG